MRRVVVTGIGIVSPIGSSAAEVTASGVPMLAVDDSLQIAEHAASLGLLDTAQVDAVRSETRAAHRLPHPADLLRPRDGRRCNPR